MLVARGLSTDAEKPTKLDYDVVEAADVVITMGCGETCRQDLDTVRRIVDDVDARVRKLLTDLGVTVEDGSEAQDTPARASE